MHDKLMIGMGMVAKLHEQNFGEPDTATLERLQRRFEKRYTRRLALAAWLRRVAARLEPSYAPTLDRPRKT